jgi:hypothetical protein
MRNGERERKKKNKLDTVIAKQILIKRLLFCFFFESLTLVFIIKEKNNTNKSTPSTHYYIKLISRYLQHFDILMHGTSFPVKDNTI